MSDTPFQRTVCACERCTQHCKEQPGPLAPVDLGRIEASKLAASPGAIVSLRGQLSYVGTIVPQTKPDGSCVFLDAQDRCTIHATSPFGCAYFDAHMGRQEAYRRATWYLSEIMKSKEYADLRAVLPRARAWNPKPLPEK